MPASSFFICAKPEDAVRAQAILQRLPVLAGDSIQLVWAPRLRDRHGPVHAGSFLRERRIALNCSRQEFPRILVHEIFHFVWLHLPNAVRWSYEDLLRREMAAGSPGELGWSAEWRKRALPAAAMRTRNRLWREYCCESFCDSAAWLFAGVRGHAEFTLAARYRARRRDWFARIAAREPLSI